MDKTLFKITKMDCAAEESLIRMKLESINAIKALEFNLNRRELTAYHDGELNQIEQALEDLKLNTSLIETSKTEKEVPGQTLERNLLAVVLMINAAFFIIEITTGLLAKSMGLLADSLDMLADAFVYTLSLIAVGLNPTCKKQIAKLSGYLQLSLAGFGFIEVLRRFFGLELLPDYRTMIVVSIFALIANGICLVLLQRSRSKEVHMQASMIFTSNDIIINLGVIAAAIFVSLFNTGLPDLMIGTAVFMIVIRGAMRILKLAT